MTALLCGAENFVPIAPFGRAKESRLRTFPALRNGIFSHDTFRRVLMVVAPNEFSAMFLNRTQSLRQALGAQRVALHGKTVRRSFTRPKVEVRCVCAAPGPAPTGRAEPAPARHPLPGGIKAKQLNVS